MGTCESNPYTNEHYWMPVDGFNVCMFCEVEDPIRKIVVVEVKGVYL
jgi:hypothetical protein